MRLKLQKQFTLPQIPAEWTLQADYRRTETDSTILRLENAQGVVLLISTVREAADGGGSL